MANVFDHKPAREFGAYRVDGAESAKQCTPVITLATTEQPPTSVLHALATVTTAGTQVQLATNTVRSVTIKATAANTGIIYVGASSVSSSDGFPLAAGDTVSLDIANTNLIWIDSSVNGETCSWIANV